MDELTRNFILGLETEEYDKTEIAKLSERFAIPDRLAIMLSAHKSTRVKAAAIMIAVLDNNLTFEEMCNIGLNCGRRYNMAPFAKPNLLSDYSVYLEVVRQLLEYKKDESMQFQALLKLAQLTEKKLSDIEDEFLLLCDRLGLDPNNLELVDDSTVAGLVAASKLDKVAQLSFYKGDICLTSCYDFDFTFTEPTKVEIEAPQLNIKCKPGDFIIYKKVVNGEMVGVTKLSFEALSFAAKSNSQAVKKSTRYAKYEGFRGLQRMSFVELTETNCFFAHRLTDLEFPTEEQKANADNLANKTSEIQAFVQNVKGNEFGKANIDDFGVITLKLKSDDNQYRILTYPGMKYKLDGIIAEQFDHYMPQWQQELEVLLERAKFVNYIRYKKDSETQLTYTDDDGREHLTTIPLSKILLKEMKHDIDELILAKMLKKVDEWNTQYTELGFNPIVLNRHNSAFPEFCASGFSLIDEYQKLIDYVEKDLEEFSKQKS